MPDAVKVSSVGDDLSIATEAGVTLTLAGIMPSSAELEGAKAELERALMRGAAVRVTPEPGSKAAYVEYVAFEDRTGPVWVDAGRMLVSMGYAKAASTAFSRQSEYRHTEQQATNNVTPRYPVE